MAMPTTQHVLNLLKKNAPVVYEKFASKRQFELRARLEAVLYSLKDKNLTDTEIRRIHFERDQINEELALFGASGDHETPTPTAGKTV